MGFLAKKQKGEPQTTNTSADVAAAKGGVSFKQLFSKKWIKITVASVCAVALVVGLLFSARTLMGRGKKAAVISVSEIAETWWYEDGNSGYGIVQSGGVQQVYLNNDMLVEQIYVTEGEHVVKGQKLLRYDATMMNLKVENLRIQYEIAKNNLTKAKDKLAYYQTFTPYSRLEAPTLMELLDDSCFVDDDGNALIPSSGQGSEESPFIYEFDCGLDTVLDRSFYTALAALNAPDADDLRTYYGVKLNVWHEDEDGACELLTWLIAPDDAANRPTMPYQEQESAGGGWPLGSFVIISEQGDVTVKSSWLGFFSAMPAVKNSVRVEYEKSLTQDEIDELIKDQQSAIKYAQIAVMQAEIDYKKEKANSFDGIVKASMDGLVSYVGDPSSNPSGEPIISVQTGSAYKILSTISESMLGTYGVGDTITVNLWSVGETFTATISEISSYPSQNNFSYSMENPNCSYYDFLADIDCGDITLRYGDGGEISFGGNGESDSFAIPGALVREEEGRSYVMVAGENDRLEKRYVSVGKSYSGGYYVEILAGLSFEDYIAFPYGSNAVVGAKVNYDSQEFYNW